MFALKDIMKNKISSLIIVIMMIISLLGFNIVFNIFFTSFIKSHESKVISDSNKTLSLTFENEQTNNKINNLINLFVKDGSNIAYTKVTTFKEELFEREVSINSISSPDMFKYNLIKGRNITKQEIEDGKKVAVTSKNYESFCKNKNNKLYINIENQDYEVVGMIGNRHSISYYHLSIFIPYTAATKIWSTDNKAPSIQFITGNKNINIDKYKEEFNIKKANFSSLQ